MYNIKKLEKVIKEEINKKRRLGEHTGGSGHLGFRSIVKFNLGEPREIPHHGEQVYEIICEYEVYTETEFMHSPENDIYYTEHYRDKIIFNKDLKILEYKELK